MSLVGGCFLGIMMLLLFAQLWNANRIEEERSRRMEELIKEIGDRLDEKEGE